MPQALVSEAQGGQGLAAGAGQQAPSSLQGRRAAGVIRPRLEPGQDRAHAPAHPRRDQVAPPKYVLSTCHAWASLAIWIIIQSGLSNF